MKKKGNNTENVYELIQKRLKFILTNLIIFMSPFREARIAGSYSTYALIISVNII